MQIGRNQHHWGVILAGGEGIRLRSLTRLVSGDDTPKQFCPLLGGRTLLSRTKQRIARTICPDRTLFVLLGSHERFYNRELRDADSQQMLVQPANRGTLPAILSSLVRIAREDPDAVVAFFPSDHHYTEEDKFMCGIRLAFETAEANPESVLLLGVAAKHAETDYGWIEAAPSISSGSRNGLLRVKHFWEKPSPRLAQDLLERGCVWNTFVMVGRAQAFLDMIRAGAPRVYREFEPWLDPGSMFDADALGSIYARLADADFSKLVLSAVPEQLGVWCLGDVGWSDLGDPGRVVAALFELGAKDEWMHAWNDRLPAAMAIR